VNDTAPTTIIKSSSQAFSVSLKAIKEVDQENKLVSELSLEGRNFTYAQSNTSEYSAWTYNTTLDNEANLSILIRYFTNVTSIQFANETTVYSGNTIKLNVIISNWPFTSLENTLEVVMDARDAAQQASTCNIKSQSDPNSGSLQWITITINGEVMYGQFYDRAVVDSRIRVISFALNDDGTVTAIIPHFWIDAEIDPNFSVLVGTDAKDDCSKDSGVDAAVYIGVFCSIGGILAVAVAFKLTLYPRIRTRLQTRKANRLAGSDLSTLASSSSRTALYSGDGSPARSSLRNLLKKGGKKHTGAPSDFNIDRQQELSISTAAGRFTVQL